MTWAYRVWGKVASDEIAATFPERFQQIIDMGLIEKVDGLIFGTAQMRWEEINYHLVAVEGRITHQYHRAALVSIDGKMVEIPYQFIFNQTTRVLAPHSGHIAKFEAPLWLLKDRGIIK